MHFGVLMLATAVASNFLSAQILKPNLALVPSGQILGKVTAVVVNSSCASIYSETATTLKSVIL